METLTCPRVLVGGVASGVGKSLVTLGLAFELRRRGLGVSCAVVGPALQQSIILKRATGRYTRTLDEFLLSAGQNLHGLFSASVGADFLLIDGHSGLFDGHSATSMRGADAQMAALTNSPVLLIADAKGYGASMAAVIRGFTAFSPQIDIAGVVLNRVDAEGGKDGHTHSFFQGVFQQHQLRPLFGSIPQLALEAVLPPSRATQKLNLTSLPRQFFVEVAAAVARFIDIDQVIRSGQLAAPVELAGLEHRPAHRRTRIAVADDGCFSLGFQDNIDLLRYLARRWSPFRR